LDLTLKKYAFSNAIAASVKLGMLEAKLDRIIDIIEFNEDESFFDEDITSEPQPLPNYRTASSTTGRPQRRPTTRPRQRPRQIPTIFS
jgi:hypothetical protein